MLVDTNDAGQLQTLDRPRAGVHMTNLRHTIFFVSILLAYGMRNLQAALYAEQCLGGQCLQLGVFSGPEGGEGGEYGDEVLEVVEGFSIQLGGDVLAHLAIAEGVGDVIGCTCTRSIYLETDVEDDGLKLVLPTPGIGSKNGGDVEIAKVDCVELRSHGGLRERLARGV